MTSRAQILAAVLQNQPENVALPDIDFLKGAPGSTADQFISTLTTIGGRVVKVNSYDEIVADIAAAYHPEHRILTLIPELARITPEVYLADPAGHPLHNVELAVLKAHFGVAENGAVWVTEDLIGHRALPFITQHLAVVINQEDIVPTMHEAYQRNAGSVYNYGTFIAGPSKTADIEQSLVIGAHGSRSMVVYLLSH